MLKNKKVIIISGITIILGLGFGVWYSVNFAKNKMYAQIMTYANSPEIRKQIEDATKQLNDNPEIVNKITAESGKTQVDNIEKSATAALQATPKATATGLNNNSSTTHETGKTSATEPDKHSSLPNNEMATGEKNDTNSPAVQQAPANKPVLENRAQAESFALKHFSASEITHYFALYQERSSLTAEQKAEIKKEILSRFTPQEIQSMLQATKK